MSFPFNRFHFPLNNKSQSLAYGGHVYKQILRLRQITYKEALDGNNCLG